MHAKEMREEEVRKSLENKKPGTTCRNKKEAKKVKKEEKEEREIEGS